MDLSIIVPARNEIFLAKTIENILENIRGNTEIIAVLDGYWPTPGIEDNPKVTIIHHTDSIGQRAASNEAVKISKAKCIMKVDAHCSFDEGFDVKMMQEMHNDWTLVPIMKNLHAFDWVCKKCGNRTYQGTTPVECIGCDNKTDFERDIVWRAKDNPQSTSYCFDPTPHFQYFREFKGRPEGQGELTETMSLQGSCFMLTRDKYWELNICDEAFGSWGSQGIEIAVKTWLSGGRVVVNHKTWYAHMFRTKGGDFGFPYQISGRQIQGAKQHARDLFFNNKWDKQIRPLSWLVEKFWPVPGWSEQDLLLLKGETKEIKIEVEEQVAPICSTSTEKLTKGIVYYTDNRCPEPFVTLVKNNLLSISKDKSMPIVSVSLLPIDFGKNISMQLERGYSTMFKQILKGLESIETDIIFLCEHDIFYSKEHFDFTPPEKDKFYYNQNTWQIRSTDGHAVYWDCKKTSQLCAYKELLITHYKERVRRVEAEGFSRRMGFEPGSHNRPERVDDYKSDIWRSSIPNLDIRHDKNLSESRWNQSEFRSQRSCRNWKESHLSKIEGWENLKI